MATIAFPNYTQIPSRLSLTTWRAIRAISPDVLITARACPLLVPLVARRPVEAQGHGEPPLRIGEAGRRAVAAVAEGAGGGVVAIAVGHRLRPVLDRIHDEAQPPVQRVEPADAGQDAVQPRVLHRDQVGHGLRRQQRRRQQLGGEARDVPRGAPRGVRRRALAAELKRWLTAGELVDRAATVRSLGRRPRLSHPTA